MARSGISWINPESAASASRPCEACEARESRELSGLHIMTGPYVNEFHLLKTQIRCNNGPLPKSHFPSS